MVPSADPLWLHQLEFARPPKQVGRSLPEISTLRISNTALTLTTSGVVPILVGWTNGRLITGFGIIRVNCSQAVEPQIACSLSSLGADRVPREADAILLLFGPP